MASNTIEELQRTAPYNWLDDLFWLRKAYLEGRYSLLIHSNWWLALQDDPLVPTSVRLSDKPEPFNDWQLRRAAWITKQMLAYKRQIDE
jgi:carnitine O-acetyltransferase